MAAPTRLTNILDNIIAGAVFAVISTVAFTTWAVWQKAPTWAIPLVVLWTMVGAMAFAAVVHWIIARMKAKNQMQATTTSEQEDHIVLGKPMPVSFSHKTILVDVGMLDFKGLMSKEPYFEIHLVVQTAQWPVSVQTLNGTTSAGTEFNQQCSSQQVPFKIGQDSPRSLVVKQPIQTMQRAEELREALETTGINGFSLWGLEMAGVANVGVSAQPFVYRFRDTIYVRGPIPFHNQEHPCNAIGIGQVFVNQLYYDNQGSRKN